MDDKKVQIQRLMDTLLKVKEQKELRENLREQIESQSVPMEHVYYSEDNFNSKFPNNKVMTPTGEIPLSYYQFRKLSNKGRKKYIDGMEKTLTDPSVIIKDIRTKGDRKGEKAELGYRGFTNIKEKGMMSVIADKTDEGKNKFVISAYPLKIDDYLDKLKDTADITYRKPYSGGTAGNDPQNLANKNIDDTQSPNNITQPDPVVNRKIDRLNTLLQGEKQRKRGLYERSF